MKRQLPQQCNFNLKRERNPGNAASAVWRFHLEASRRNPDDVVCEKPDFFRTLENFSVLFPQNFNAAF
jgi:hypothetical protein